MYENIDRLSRTLNLSPFQRQMLTQNADEYDMRGIAVRGGVLYVRRRPHGIIDMIKNVFIGAPADVLGRARIFHTMCRGITLRTGGYCRMRVGRRVFYFNCDGQCVSRQAFNRAHQN